jgi:hypothetical protein
MRIVASQNRVSEMLARLQPIGKADGWTSRHVDPQTKEGWIRVQLGSEYHGGGLPVLLREPEPSIRDLLEIAATSDEPAEVAASAWLLAERDQHGGYREELVAVAESAANQGDQSRAALLVGWGRLADSSNLRPTIGKTPAEVSADHQHFKTIADRAKGLLHLTVDDPLLRDPRVFGGEPR